MWSDAYWAGPRTGIVFQGREADATRFLARGDYIGLSVILDSNWDGSRTNEVSQRAVPLPGLTTEGDRSPHLDTAPGGQTATPGQPVTRRSSIAGVGQTGEMPGVLSSKTVRAHLGKFLQ